MEQELLTLPEHLNSPPIFSGVRVTRSLVLYVCFVDRCLSFCTFSFGHCVVCSSLIYGFWLPLWYLRYMDSDYPFGILDMDSDYSFGILDMDSDYLPLVSYIYGFWLLFTSQVNNKFIILSTPVYIFSP
jgi:hypothetical protein